MVAHASLNNMHDMKSSYSIVSVQYKIIRKGFSRDFLCACFDGRFNNCLFEFVCVAVDSRRSERDEKLGPWNGWWELEEQLGALDRHDQQQAWSGRRWSSFDFD